jgi:hypothetical protein
LVNNLKSKERPINILPKKWQSKRHIYSSIGNLFTSSRTGIERESKLSLRLGTSKILR